MLEDVKEREELTMSKNKSVNNSRDKMIGVNLDNLENLQELLCSD